MAKTVKDAKAKKKTKSKTELDETKPHMIKEKSYLTKQIETSITLLESPEDDLVLEALLFLSKFADLQRSNLEHVRSHGLLPKLLALLGHNICILRVSLRLLSQLLAVDAAQIELNHEKFDEAVIKICGFYVSHKDVHVKEFSILILATYSTLGKTHILLTEPGFIAAILKTIKKPENDTILIQSLLLFNKLIEIETIRKGLLKEQDFSSELLIRLMERSEDCFINILYIFEKLTYFNEDELLKCFKEAKLVEHLFNIIIDPKHIQYAPICLTIITHCMNNDNIKSYFVTSLEFLKFCKWVKTCPDSEMQLCSSILLELSKIDQIRQMLFDLSIEDVILSFLRSNDKKVLNTTCEAISFMSKHKYCCEKMLTPVVIKKVLEIMQRTGDAEDPENEIALSTLHYFCKRDSRTIHMIRTYDGIGVLVKYMKKPVNKLSQHSYKKVLEIINMLVTSNQLQTLILSKDLYEVILAQTWNKFDEICMRSLEIMINCLNHEDFQNYFLLNQGSQVVVDKLSNTSNEQLIRLLVIFVHNALIYENLAKDLVYKKLLLTLKNIPENIKYRNPLIERSINLIYNMCLPIKFFEKGRLELTDTFKEKFYIINGPWNQPFPFLEILQLRNMSTLSSLYIISENVKSCTEEDDETCLNIQEQTSINVSSLSSVSSLSTQHAVNYGYLSHDPYLPKYIQEIKRLLSGVYRFEDKIKILAKFVHRCLCGPDEDATISDKLHTFKLHIACIKQKLGTNMIPIGYLRLGFHCERALLFKALADHVYLPVTLVKGKNKLYWNEVALIKEENNVNLLKMFVVDLMDHIGHLLPIGSRECNAYCDIH